jgi:hypothetical protein
MALVVVLCLGFFVLGPLVDNYVISSQMPYLIIDESMVEKARTDCECGNVPAVPIELTTDGTTQSGNLVKLPVEKVPKEYLQYVHYPDNWNEWWNMFNPMNNFAVWLSRILFGACVLGGIGVVIYFTYLWRKKRFKWQRNPSEGDGL